ncbi:hypothetical protein K4K54_008636 [Colletotrichum sp. SAR 10_86]|nr:hypothetical protein KHU50_008599 [Colletotrichum sp. SAR 10_65]KAI8220361.1 hypothetical protein K4K54_008636 [Colletotrichum sp. SAR 10_86]
MWDLLRWSVWGQQIWALVGAVGALITMVALLGKFNNHPIFSEMGVTLNTGISVLSVTFKAAVAFILSECIAQWKWILYAREERLMIDFDRLDGAARGPMGSLRVLLRTRGALIVQLGAILTLSAIALDPFAQQLLRIREDITYEKSTNNSSALVSKAATYSLGVANVEGYGFTNFTFDTGRNEATRHDTTHWNVTTRIPPSTEGAIMSGFYKSPEELQRETLFQCSSGNCSSDPFVTLGVCHRCKDLTAKLTRMPGSYDELMNAVTWYRSPNIDGVKIGGPGFYATGYSLPNGHFIANTDGCRPYHGDGKCRSKSYAATSFGSKKQSPEVTWPGVSLKALECGLYYCAKTINSKVQNGRLEEIVAEAGGSKRSQYSWDSLDPESFYTVNNTELAPEYRAPSDEARSLEFHKLWSVATYNPLTIMINSTDSVMIQSESIKSISAYIQGLFRWEPWYNDTKILNELHRLEGMENAVGFNGASFGPVKSFREAGQPPALDRLVSITRSDFAGISVVFESMALSMTNEIRRTSAQVDVAHNGMETMTYEGLVGRTVVLYEVKWQWIALHVTVLALACTLMLMTIINTGSNVDVPLWKSSSLAALRRGHDIGGLLNDSGKSVANMEDAARKMYMSGRRIDDEETKHQGEQYAGLVESRRASEIDLNEELAERSITDTGEERSEPPNPA